MKLGVLEDTADAFEVYRFDFAVLLEDWDEPFEDLGVEMVLT